MDQKVLEYHVGPFDVSFVDLIFFQFLGLTIGVGWGGVVASF